MIDPKLFSALAFGLVFGAIGIVAGRHSPETRVMLIRWGLLCGLGYGGFAWFACLVSGNSLTQEFAARRSWSSFALSITTGALLLWLFHLFAGRRNS